MTASSRKYLAACAATMLLAVTLSACGGGGGPATSDGDDMMPDDGMMPETQPTADRASISRDTFINAARARPRVGSVTQSSNVDADGVTIDQIEADVQYGGPSRDEDEHIFVVRNGSSWTVGTSTDMSYIENGSHPRWRGSGIDGRIGSSAILSVGIITDIENENDTDYLLLGIWLVAPDDVSDRENYVYGVFVDGGDPFQQSNVQTLQGTATYAGLAVGHFTSPNHYYIGPDGIYDFVDNFVGELRLEADFGDAISVRSAAHQSQMMVMISRSMKWRVRSILERRRLDRRTAVSSRAA